MTTAFVLGNGISRKAISLLHLRQYGPIYGCNALYRDFTPDVLVATDRPISAQIQDSGYPMKNKFYTRRPFTGHGALPVPTDYFGYSSGPIATGIAALDGYSTIYLIGFDMGPSPTQGFNNIYADTEFYRTSTSNPTYTGNWIKQLCHVMTDFPTIKFIRIMGPTSSTIKEFDSLKNLEYLDLSTFADRINNQKDL
jgi:hypothetical protein